MTVIATGSVTQFFEEVVGDAMRSRGVEAHQGTTSYLVSLLADYARPDARAEATMDRPVAFLLDEAIHTPDAAERFERLRSLGDGVLYGCGFFGEHFEARGVEKSYLFGIGATAYTNAATMLRPSGVEDGKRSMDVFGELARNFASFASVLADVADATLAMGAASSKNVLKIYERWLRTGSDRLAQSLSSQGLLPQRGPKGVQ